uniref:PPM-type phosphatase domain-containing protein n=1 Tax=Heterorhabditis bacteriophora TaxID=37862 RepID=A0A1I7WM65_HETBA
MADPMNLSNAACWRHVDDDRSAEDVHFIDTFAAKTTPTHGCYLLKGEGEEMAVKSGHTGSGPSHVSELMFE